MIYRLGERTWTSVQKVLDTKTNEVWTVQNSSEGEKKRYGTLLVIKSRKTAKLFMEVLEEGRTGGRVSQAEIFSGSDELWALYPYGTERYLEQFYQRTGDDGKRCRQICVSLAAECLASGEPWPILYLMLDQGQIHIRRDGRISLGYHIDLGRLKRNVKERACAGNCGGKILWMMEQNRELERTAGLKLIQKKLQKEGYSSFAKLLRDLCMDSRFWERQKIRDRTADFFRRNQQGILKILLACSVFLTLLAGCMFLSRTVFGELQILRLFYNSFEKIGTESLLQ